MKDTKIIISSLISLFDLAIGIIHLIYPDLKIDSIFVTLIGIAIIPWLSPLFKSIEIPGLKIEFQELEKIKNKAKELGLVINVPVEKQPSYLQIAKDDPNLALAGLRIEIEKRLRAIG